MKPDGESTEEMQYRYITNSLKKKCGVGEI
jgi:hypothetical protein